MATVGASASNHQRSVAAPHSITNDQLPALGQLSDCSGELVPPRLHSRTKSSEETTTSRVKPRRGEIHDRIVAPAQQGRRLLQDIVALTLARDLCDLRRAQRSATWSPRLPGIAAASEPALPTAATSAAITATRCDIAPPGWFRPTPRRSTCARRGSRGLRSDPANSVAELRPTGGYF